MPVIEQLRGRVARLEQDRVILDVGGVGFAVWVPSSTRGRLRTGEEASLFTHLQVREDALQLYGFALWEEKEAFEALLKVSGIGPKVGLSILSSLSARELVVAVACGDVQSLTAVSGVGKKTAQRIILELKEQMGAVAAQRAEEEGGPAVPAQESSAGSEAIAALMVLGYSAVEASKAVATAQNAGAALTPDLIREALKRLA